MSHSQASHLPPPSTPADSLLLAASQQVYNNVLLNAAAAAATTPPALAGVASAQLSPHHTATNPSSPYHSSQMRSAIGDLVVSTSGGISPTACIMETPVSLSGNPHLAAAAAAVSASPAAATLAAISSKMVSSAPVVANGLPRQNNTQLTQRNLQAIIEAIRHIEGGNMATRVAATSSPSPHSTDLLVR